jgi:spore coat protein A
MNIHRLWKVSFVLALGFIALCAWSGQDAVAQVPGGSLDPTLVPKYQSPLVTPPAMPRTGKIKQRAAKNIEYYEIAVRQFQQQILPLGLPATTVWSYGSVQYPGTVAEGGSFNYPAFTIEAKWKKPVRVKWINDLVDANGNYLPHLFPVDQTLHWANPPAGPGNTDTRGTSQIPYTGPVPIVTHVHGAHTYEESDGYPEAWYLPDALNIPGTHATGGSFYNSFNAEFQMRYNESPWEPGTAMFQYPNDQRATTLWYHDHTLGMTRLNVYAGPAGFYLLRGGPDDEVLDAVTGLPAVLPGPAPGHGDPFGTYYEIPIVIQDRSFNADGSLFYPDNRAFFEELDPAQLQIPFIPDPACDGPSDVSPIWNPEFFGNVMVVNGVSWPLLEVEPRRYRFRFLNGCNSRFLILKLDNGMPFWQIGAEGGFLPAPVALNELLIAPAERADVIVDFANVPFGSTVTLLNFGPDEPFKGGVPGVDFDPSDPGTTGQVMQFQVVLPPTGPDPSTPPIDLLLPVITPLGPATGIQRISLNEEESQTVEVVEDADGNIVLACDNPSAEPFGPIAALLGTLNPDNTGNPLKWSDAITENPAIGATEVWEIYNFTEDAHPIHIHLVQFQVVDRDPFGSDPPRPPEIWETGFKDTVITYPGEVTRVKARFDLAGLFVWHCHIIEHEDNEMMRPYRVGP